MKGGIVAVFMAVLAIVSIAVAQQDPYATVQCGQIDAALMPCITYLTGHAGDNPPPACCAGARAVKAMVLTTDDKRVACNCVKAAANRYTELDDNAAQSLPRKCNVQLDIPVSRNVDCNKIA